MPGKDKASVLLIGCGGIGTVGALNLEIGGLASVTAVLRSNYDAVVKKGFTIDSIDHGKVEGFRPARVINEVPEVSREGAEQYDYIVVVTKNIPDINPTCVDVVRPAVTPGKTAIVLIQNGLNIEKPFFKAFPENIVLSGVTMCGAHEYDYGTIIHDDYDRIKLAAFRNPNLRQEDEDDKAKDFCRRYAAGGKTAADFAPDVKYTRWRKLLYNATLNPICALTDLDSGRIRLAPGLVETMVRPAMEEIRAAAKANGVELEPELMTMMIECDPITLYNPPSMHVDVRKGRYIEFENLVGEPLRAGKERGVAMPTIEILYNFCKGIQWRTRERKGDVKIEPKDHYLKAQGLA